MIEEKQLKVINHYGFDNQLKQLREECTELGLAICKYERFGFSECSIDKLDNLVEEITDVLNLIEQIQLKDNYIAEGIERMREYKVDRELERIKKNE